MGQAAWWMAWSGCKAGAKPQRGTDTNNQPIDMQTLIPDRGPHASSTQLPSPSCPPAPLDLRYPRVVGRGEGHPGTACQPRLFRQLSPAAGLVAGMAPRIKAAGRQAVGELVQSL